ncbi:MAG: rhamnan synthesis F family protein [Anaerolineaceae bacterium]
MLVLNNLLQNVSKLEKQHDTAVILHIYYPEMFAEIVEYLKNLDDDFDLYVSLPENNAGFADQIVSAFPNVKVLLLENRGRDIGPFLEIHQRIKSLGYRYYLKLHTKKSPHRTDGDQWRRDVYTKLLGSRENVRLIKERLAEDRQAGIIGPQGHILDYRLYAGANEAGIKALAKQAGLLYYGDSSFFFVAGTMFWAKPEAFQVLDKLNLSINDFETEPVGPDGALVHAMERFFGLAVHQASFDILEVNESGAISAPEIDGAYPYAAPPMHLILENIRSVVFFSIYQEEYAIEYLRIIAPLRQAGIEIIPGVQDGEVMVERVLDGDAVLFQREFPGNLVVYDQIVTLARQANKPILYDLDDLLFALPENHPERIDKVYTTALLPMLTAVEEADLVAVPTERLREMLSGYNDNILVLPNYLDDTLWSLRPPQDRVEEGKPLVIGYMGSNSHTPDLELIVPVVRELLQRYAGKIQFRFWGAEPPESLRGRGPAVVWTPSPSNNYREFARYFQTQTADIFVAPLVDNYFNQCKSPLKFFEYSALGATGVYSHIRPYEGVITDGYDGLLASSQEEWLTALTRLIEDGNLRKTLANNAQQTVREKWLLTRNIHNWQDIFGRLEKPIFSEKASKPFTVYIVESISQQHYHALVSNQERIGQLTDQKDQLEYQLINNQEEISQLIDQKDQLEDQLINNQEEISQLTDQKDQLEGQVESLSRQLDSTSDELNEVYRSKSWKIAVFLGRPGKAITKIKNLAWQFGINPLKKYKRLHDLGRDTSLLKASELFDEEWYAEQNPDVKAAGMESVRHYLLYGGFEGRNPSPDFDSNWYLNTYPDVKQAGINPLVHYLRFGQSESRLLKEKTPFTLKQIEIQEAAPENILLAPELRELIQKEMTFDRYVLSISHDNYLEVTGGVQVIIMDEQAHLNRTSVSYLHLFPHIKGKLLITGGNAPCFIGVNLDGAFLGNTEVHELLEALGGLPSKSLNSVHIHHTMGFTLQALQEILAFAGHHGVFWLHDCFSLCPSYHLLRNDIEYCGAPNLESNECHICMYGELRQKQQEAFRSLFAENDLEVAAPSRFALDFWQAKFPHQESPGRVVSPLQLKWISNSPLKFRQGPLRIGFPGYPLEHKGWQTWMNLVTAQSNSEHYKFFHFSSVGGTPGNYKRIYTEVTRGQRLVMVNMLRHHQIDVAFLWSTVPETFSFTLHEALAAGCFIVTNTKSGNIQDYLTHNPRQGIIISDEKKLADLFAGEELIRMVQNYQKDGKPRAVLVFGEE